MIGFVFKFFSVPWIISDFSMIWFFVYFLSSVFHTYSVAVWISSAKWVLHGYLSRSLRIVKLLICERGIFCCVQWVRFAVCCYGFFSAAVMRTAATLHRFAQFFSDHFYHFFILGPNARLSGIFHLDTVQKDTAIFFIKLQSISLLAAPLLTWDLQKTTKEKPRAFPGFGPAICIHDMPTPRSVIHPSALSRVQLQRTCNTLIHLWRPLCFSFCCCPISFSSFVISRAWVCRWGTTRCKCLC